MQLDTINLDEYDFKILSYLEEDASISLSKISKEIGKSREFCDYRFKKLKECDIISNIRAVINPTKLGFQTYNFLFELQNISYDKQMELEQYLINSKYTKFVSLASGSWEYQVTLFIKDLNDLNIFLEDLNQQYGRYIKNNNFHLRAKTLYVGSFLDVLSKKAIIKNQSKTSPSNSLTVNLDELDSKILEIYSKDASLSVKEIALKLDTTFEKVRYKLDKLKKENIISSLEANINYTTFNYNKYSLALKINSYTKNFEKELKKFLIETKNSLYAIKTIGNWDIRIEIVAKNQNEFKNFILELRKKFGENIAYSNFAIQLNELKKVSFPKQ
jgi:Lrp/AsnC family transcriptional regulator for asnA, asnC and gidA